jgi:hypothetical protein
MKKLAVLVTLSLFIRLGVPGVSAQTEGEVKEKLKDTEFDEIYPAARRGNITKVLEMLDSFSDENLTEKQFEIKEKFYKRFREQNEEIALETEDPFVRFIIEAFHDYWRKVFLGKSSLEKAGEKLESNVKEYLFENDLVGPLASLTYNWFSFDKRIKKILKSRGYYSIMGTTQPYRELMIWKEETEQEYVAQLPQGEHKVKVVFMGNFVSYGWGHYASLGKSQAGGWATEEAIYCVVETYDISSEKFRVSVLVHEGQHFADCKMFPKLWGADLEYRAKLAELSCAEDTINSKLKNYIDDSKYDKTYPHSFANYCLIRDLSRKLFNEEFVSNVESWEAMPVKRINEASAELLKQNTTQLKSAGPKRVTEFIQ